MSPHQHGHAGHKRKRAADEDVHDPSLNVWSTNGMPPNFGAAPLHASYNPNSFGMWPTGTLQPLAGPSHHGAFWTASEPLQRTQAPHSHWPIPNEYSMVISDYSSALVRLNSSSPMHNTPFQGNQSYLAVHTLPAEPHPGFHVSDLPAELVALDSTQDKMELETAFVGGSTIESPSSCLCLDPGELVCLGVIGGIVGKCERPLSAKPSVVHEAIILSPSHFAIVGNTDTQGHIASEHLFLLQDILESGIELRVRCSFESSVRKQRELLPCQLDIALYAPFSMLKEIQEWSEENEVFLQDPTFCFRDAKYCNPQRLSLYFDAPRMVSEVLPDATGHIMRLRSITDDDDFLDKYLASKVALQETEQPSAIKTILKSHQKQALTFMLRREMGWALHGPEEDMWSILDNANGRFYINALSGSGSEDPPPPFGGGIIADPMGLGKTLTMIALAATDLEKPINHGQVQGYNNSVSATLFIVPPPLLRVWEAQLSEHTFAGTLKFARHHAKSKLTSLSDITGVDVVITTYHTLSAEWSETGKSSSLLFSVKWRRIVLDEAHMIRNESSRMCRAMCSMEAECRWAVTGTPIQNHLNDLASLLKFIRAHPYETRKQFEADISDYWKDGKVQEAANRLQLLSSCLFLRRPKSTIELPPRYNKEYPVDFTPREREEYDKIKNRTSSAIEDALQQGLGSHRSGAYANILQQIEAMRLFCGLGLHYHARHDESSIASHSTAPWESVAQKTFKLHLEMGSLHCSQCHATIDLAQTMFDDATTGIPLFSRCLKFVCAECAAKLAKRGIEMPCGHTPSCPTAQVSTSIDVMDQAVDDQAPAAPLSTQMPSKMAALISDLKSQPADVKSIVFSTWRLTLNVLAVGLEQAGIEYLRFDGSIQQKDRHEILQRFKNDSSKRVLLLTYSCGAVGLTLTEASRAYLLEPHWNPTIEEQALGRIYRIGQDKEVTTVRLFVRDSFEMRVMEIQQSKKDLAKVILAPHDGGLADTTLEKLQYDEHDTYLAAIFISQLIPPLNLVSTANGGTWCLIQRDPIRDGDLIVGLPRRGRPRASPETEGYTHTSPESPQSSVQSGQLKGCARLHALDLRGRASEQMARDEGPAPRRAVPVSALAQERPRSMPKF
ncbi:hypothetical protein NLG97_g4558 [Lecanicillium saksenae]|uniref:Uncharacterized protein n=1 Tax=Lecanicillium saksenae TaxID=468837 RepID=A0ACC1QWS6_9HYPO|nr:hypothetical protein NLG97_g4558 [Lecanicillium saksenae]